MTEVTSSARYGAPCPRTCSPDELIGECRQSSIAVVQLDVSLITITGNVIIGIITDVIGAHVTSRYPFT